MIIFKLVLRVFVDLSVLVCCNFVILVFDISIKLYWSSVMFFGILYFFVKFGVLVILVKFMIRDFLMLNIVLEVLYGLLWR